MSFISPPFIDCPIVSISFEFDQLSAGEWIQITNEDGSLTYKIYQLQRQQLHPFDSKKDKFLLKDYSSYECVDLLYCDHLALGKPIAVSEGNSPTGVRAQKITAEAAKDYFNQQSLHKKQRAQEEEEKKAPPPVFEGNWEIGGMKEMDSALHRMHLIREYEQEYIWHAGEGASDQGALWSLDFAAILRNGPQEGHYDRTLIIKGNKIKVRHVRDNDETVEDFIGINNRSSRDVILLNRESEESGRIPAKTIEPELPTSLIHTIKAEEQKDRILT